LDRWHARKRFGHTEIPGHRGSTSSTNILTTARKKSGEKGVGETKALRATFPELLTMKLIWGGGGGGWGGGWGWGGGVGHSRFVGNWGGSNHEREPYGNLQVKREDSNLDNFSFSNDSSKTMKRKTQF